MIEANDILALIGIPSETIKDCYFKTIEDTTHIFIELKDTRPRCPYCKSHEIGIKDYYKVKINNSIIKHKKIVVWINQRRYICKTCKKSFKQKYAIAENKNTISNAVKLAVVEDLKEVLTFKQIALDHHISVPTVIKIFDNFVLEQLRLPLSEIICIDEFCFKHTDNGMGKYPAVITDPIKGQIIDIIESRWKDVLVDYFNKIPIVQRTNVKYFVSDMNETYRSIKKAFFKEAIHIADRFHVIKAFNDAITKIRTRIIKQEVWKEDEYVFLKKNWKIFLKDRTDVMTYSHTNKYGHKVFIVDGLDHCLKKYPDLYYAYWTTVEYKKATNDLMLFSEAEDIINFNINKLTKSSIAEMAVLGKTLQNWKLEIINGLTKNPYSLRISNAVAEATNNQIQTLIDLCYGLPVYTRMRKRVIYINRNKHK